MENIALQEDTSQLSFITGASCAYSFPTFGGSSVCVSADTAFFTYDAAGRVLQADNVYARVHRTYKPNGLVASEAQSLRSYNSNGTSACDVDPAGGSASLFSNHNYTLTYTYDLDGRRTALAHPAGTQHYTYDPASPSTGRLTSVTDIANLSYSLAYDAAGRLRQVAYPGSVNEVMTYGSDGRLSVRDIPNVLHDTYWYDARDRVDSVNNQYRAGLSSGLTARTWYNGLGAVIFGDNYGYAGGWTEQFSTDALGNRLRTQQKGMKPPTDPDYYGIRFSTYDQDAKLTKFADTVLANNQDSYEEDYRYDGAANLSLRYAQETDFYNNSAGVFFDAGISYYGADGKLRLYNRHIGVGSVSDDSRQGHRGVFEEYRYDALGRRVLVRSRRGSVCANMESTYGLECAAYIERVVWDGEQVLIEDRADGSDGLSASALDLETSTGDPYGRVVYAHGLGLDEPLSVNKGGTVVMPHANWQGQYEVGTLSDGRSTATCGCLQIDWPGGKTMLDGEKPPQSAPLYVWFGNLITDKADGSGQHYMRNRYYDPKTGRFTQEDPIGLAGGLNVYGFANGDPVNFSDPLGLCPPDKPLCQWITAGLMAAGTDIGGILGGGAGLLAGPGAVVTSPAGAIAGMALGAGAGLAAGKLIDHLFFSEAERARSGESEQPGGAKSAAEYDRHIEGVQRAKGQLGELEEQLGRVKGPKAQRPIREQIERLQREIQGHEKEIRQKWPNGRPN